ncbi:MAG: anti-sigma factor [Chitinophagaceae bacterium]
MNIKEYIASGIVESYVLGLAGKEEMAEFERMCAANQEVLMAREAFEKQLEQHALKSGITPPVQLQSKIFSEIEVEADKLKSNGAIVNDPELVRDAPVVNMRWWKYAAVASIVLLLGSAVLNFYYLDQFKTYKNLYLTAQTDYANKEKAIQTRLDTYESSMAVLKDTNMAVIKMKGVGKSPESLATVYWDKRSKDVHLMVNNLPAPAPGKQYQLWALVNGQPVDAGMLNWDQATGVARMKNIPAAQGFAITLEKEGGSPTPDMNAMYVLGTI